MELGTSVTLAIAVWGEEVRSCTLRTWNEFDGEERIPMQPADELSRDHRSIEGVPSEGARWFRATVTPRRLGILWYSFIIDMPQGAMFFGAQEGRTGGVGVLSWGEPPSFQITVYEKRQTPPSWFAGGVVYQIFPDRYRRGNHALERVKRELAADRRGIARRLVDWSTLPTYEKDESQRVIAWDFYGGDLEGVRDRLPQLAEMGVTAIYLNPIFQATSNHRYDTADYLRIDPLLGTEEDFVSLAQAAEEHGISLILDGVFNHTGADSRYFNRFGNYEDAGAWQSNDSPYYPWYTFHDDGTYEGWWGVDDLPAIRKDSASWQEFIAGAGGIVEKWTRLGAHGWRLDVADELSEPFIKAITRAATSVKSDALVLGEVWEDASNKISYSQMRHYLNGGELDSVMNYPFRDALIGYLVGTLSAGDFAETMESLHENYPPAAFALAMNLIGSHDRPRIFTLLGGAPDPATLSEEQRCSYRLSPDQRGLAKGRLWLALLVQMLTPGVPSIYYGDEVGMEGFSDPANRGSYPWGGGDADVPTMFRNALQLRRRLPVVRDGGFKAFAPTGDIYAFWRFSNPEHSGESACILVNRSTSATHEVALDAPAPLVDDLVTGRVPVDENGKLRVTLYPFGSSVLYFRDDDQGYAKQLVPGKGMVCHITSLPKQDGPGTFGACAKQFIDWLAKEGYRYWQVLPLTPPDAYGSPYAGMSLFAGNPRLIDTGGRTLEECFAAFAPDEGYERFVRDEATWLHPFATFCAIKDILGNETRWQKWGEPYRTYRPELAGLSELRDRVCFHMFCQYLFHLQLNELLGYAHERGIELVGDMPIYVSADSSDVWANPELFVLDEAGEPALLAGAPPDNFSDEGQLWGNPVYRWDAIADSGYAFWIERLSRAFELYDYVRLDHFLGFESYYTIERGKTAKQGKWRTGPGEELFRAAHDALGDLPLIAEDLGIVTPAVRCLTARCGFPGMDVVQFADYDVRWGYHPAPRKVVYTSTHDTPTLLGWVKKRFPEEGNPEELAKRLTEEALATSSEHAVFVTLQDVLGLGDEARMNVPGVAEGNWRWQAPPDALS